MEIARMPRVFVISDLHIDFDENEKWLNDLSLYDYKDDILILGGDIIDIIPSLENAFKALKDRFAEVIFTPGNHDLWVCRNNLQDSLVCFNKVKDIAADCGILMEPAKFGRLTIVPLYGWYDYTFGQPTDSLLYVWSDFSACKWPDGYDLDKITDFFISMNEKFLDIQNEFIISFSHFMPRIDVMPFYIPPNRRTLYPVLGTTLLEAQIRKLGSKIHVYGHSHVNMHVHKDGILYINNAFGYPTEKGFTLKKLLNIYEF